MQSEHVHWVLVDDQGGQAADVDRLRFVGADPGFRIGRAFAVGALTDTF
ncbi:hypothetical protein RMSM_03409 [Rhodopirellula maiorica SM1]|uniref:Uncharacterized protein n=1 Tax=Rhodopirellula maiorica SM1 TaxID=1265738 RepID=M5RK34_9BACT|nr:hypothetical protein RMSM_03409 [Rhodopirellula maiorica SM1]